MYTFFLIPMLLIDQGLLNILIISQSIHSQHARTHHNETQMRYVGFETKVAKSTDLDYNKYISKEPT